MNLFFFKSRHKLFPGKLWSRWFRPLVVKRVTPYEAIKVWSESADSFMMNEGRLKHYISRDVVEHGMNFKSKEPP